MSKNLHELILLWRNIVQNKVLNDVGVISIKLQRQDFYLSIFSTFMI